MLSVDNFYWILHERLIKPSRLDSWYYYPFGDTDTHVICMDKSFLIPRGEYHVLYGFDQEPLWTDSLGCAYESRRSTWSHRLPKILANSEHSAIKKKLCKDRGMMDWYYFYHGFAVLDWFRDGLFAPNSLDIHDVFLSLNRLVGGQRAYRIDLLARLIEADIFSRGTVSFHADLKACNLELEDSYTRISPARRRQILTALSSLGNLPCQIDGDVTSNASAQFGCQEFAIWQRSFVHVVNETVFYEPKLHLTEKIFKPIVARRPFVLSAAPGNLAYLRSYGFKTFDRWWDESYDDSLDADQRLDAIVKILVELCAKPFCEIKNMLVDMQAVLDFNHRHLYGAFRNRIVNELVDGFDACVRTWNNGRVDDRVLPLLPDLEGVKATLLQ
jgi:hypothetical protein